MCIFLYISGHIAYEGLRAKLLFSVPDDFTVSIYIPDIVYMPAVEINPDSPFNVQLKYQASVIANRNPQNLAL